MTRDWWTLTWLVVRREIRERGRARSFWVASVLLLVAVAAAAVIPALLAGGQSTVRVGVVGSSVPALSATAREAGRISGAKVIVEVLPNVSAAKAGLRSGKLAAVLVGDTEVLINKASVTGGSSAASILAEIGGLQRLYAQLPPATAAAIARHGIALPVRSLSPPTRSLATRITGLTAAILIYVIIVTYGIRITIGVGEEKASRVVEVLLTTLRPVQLLAGKVIGMGLLALAQIGSVVAVYLVLGHAVGSPNVRGADTATVLMAGLWTYSVIYASSVNPFFHVLAFIPFTAPIAMPVLVAVGAAPAWQVVVSAAIILAATVGMARLAGTIYERAILRTGSRLKVRQVLRSAS